MYMHVHNDNRDREMMNRRQVRRWVTRYGPFAGLFLIIVTLVGQPPGLVINQKAQDNSHKDLGRFVPYVIFPTHEETLSFDSYGYAYVNKKIFTYSVKRQINLEIPKMAFPTDMIYESKNIPEKVRLKVGESGVVWQPGKANLDNMVDYYNYLKTPQRHCAKLKRLGGFLDCTTGGDDDHMDGNKLVCFDEELEFQASKSPSSCLVMSFGIQQETSFDEAVTEINCEIHMFDVIDYDPDWVKEVEHAHFYQEGISPADMTHKYYMAKGKGNGTWLSKVRTLSTIMKEKNLLGRPIHVLKIDIEGFEWNVFEKDLVIGNFLDQVGQIAMEVHSTDLDDLKNATDADQLANLQRKYDILRQIEAHGFRRVSYWDNVQDKYAFYDRNKIRYETSGELLYVNTNWYNQTFKDQLRNHQGLAFRKHQGLQGLAKGMHLAVPSTFGR